MVATHSGAKVETNGGTCKELEAGDAREGKKEPFFHYSFSFYLTRGLKIIIFTLLVRMKHMHFIELNRQVATYVQLMVGKEYRVYL